MCTFSCPGCNKEIEIDVEPFDGKTFCPECSIKIEIIHNMMLDGNYEERSTYELRPMNDAKFANDLYDYFESRKI